MKLYISALVLLLVPILATGHDVPCGVDQAIRSIVDEHTSNLVLECTYITDLSIYASCPSGFTAFSCSCGKGCGSWDIQTPNKCHCQCPDVDWALVSCCKITALYI
ncbi:resistin-like [Leptodactylus fuscus]|uniref:resistin-like n=1 Tax=Leptodactylus fuscus TaxID=238119 RepID=UPI003F4E6488